MPWKMIDIKDLLQHILRDRSLENQFCFDYIETENVEHACNSKAWKDLSLHAKRLGAKPLMLKIYYDDYQQQYFRERQAAGLYLTLANMPADVERKAENQFCLALISPDTDRRLCHAALVEQLLELEGKVTMFRYKGLEEPFVVFLYALLGDRKASSEMIGHKGTNAKMPCHYCCVKKGEQGNARFDICANRRVYGSLVWDMLNTNYLYHEKKDMTADIIKLEQYHSFYTSILAPPFWLTYFDPAHQTPPCLMHNGPLGIVPKMIQNFLRRYCNEIKGWPTLVNKSVCKYERFSGLTSLPSKVFRDTGNIAKLSAVQITAFMRISPIFFWRYLDKVEFDLWMKYLNLYFDFVIQKSMDQVKLRQWREKAEDFIRSYVSCFERDLYTLKSARTSTPRTHSTGTMTWNLHVQLEMPLIVEHLGPLYLYSTDIGESMHARQKRLGIMTNHQLGRMEGDILQKNLLQMGLRFRFSSDEKTASITNETTIQRSKREFCGLASLDYAMDDELYQSAKHRLVHFYKASSKKIPKLAHITRLPTFNRMRFNGHYLCPGQFIEYDSGFGIAFAMIITFIHIPTLANLNDFWPFIVVKKLEIPEDITDLMESNIPPLESRCILYRLAKWRSCIPPEVITSRADSNGIEVSFHLRFGLDYFVYETMACQ
jgi:hypothetical protein